MTREHPEWTAQRLWARICNDRELGLAIRASGHADCVWFNAFVDDRLLPAARRGDERVFDLPVPPAKFVELMNRAIDAARFQMRETAREFDKLWSPGPRAPLLPGINWPQFERQKPKRRRVEDAERLDVLLADHLAAREPGQQPPTPCEPEPPEPEFDMDEWEEWDGTLPDWMTE